MDALRPIEIATAAPAPILAPGPAMPPESPLAMPVQALSRWSRAEERPLAASDPYRAPWLARLFVFAGAAALTAYGAYEMYQVVSVSRTTVLQWLLLLLFTVNFSWIALAFTSGLLGFVSLLRRPRRLPPLPATLRSRTAVVMPVYNESTARTFAALAAMREEIEATGLGEHFDYFVLSDSTDPDAWIAEERAFLAWRQDLGADARVHYRHRPKNHHRKAGNIADFVTRWGGAYDHMLVLDADSLMTGECIARLAARHGGGPRRRHHPDAAADHQPQHAVRARAAVRRQGLRPGGRGRPLGVDRAGTATTGATTPSSARAPSRPVAGCPTFPGRPPLGGHVLSHDFVEAALMRRAGWTVYMLHDLPGSYEESPPSLIDVAARDRRWCQGNLQHSRIIGARGLKLATRQHFATGIMSYLASPFWLFQLIVGIALVLQTTYIRPEYFSREFTLFPQWPRFDPERALALFGVTMAMLLAPKLFGLVLMLLNAEGRRRAGGAVRLVASTLIEILLSALMAPILMVIQSGSVFQILLGRDTGWQPQRRDDGSIPLRDIVRRHRWHTVLGLLTGVSAFMIATSLFLWMSPTIVGLVLAIPLSWLSGRLGAGLALKRLGLLMIPEETRTPPVVAARQRAPRRESAARLRRRRRPASPSTRTPACARATRRCCRRPRRAGAATSTRSGSSPRRRSWTRRRSTTPSIG